ncbi:MAG TPA: DUF4145 domain-containing protein [Bradyrhizobium sp.]|nr:DUF4145 domain-containing protein [Bradyrhizobium sp.]
MSKGRVKPSLFTLSRESFADEEEFNKFRDEILGPSDRASAIIGAAYVERFLICLVQGKMKTLTKKESDALFFEDKAILKTLSARIEIAAALDAISKEQKAALNSIRRVRNVFAHAVRPITFEHELISAVCKTLPFSKTSTLDVVLGPHRTIYVKCVARMMQEFSLLFAREPRAPAIRRLVSNPYLQEA